MRLISATYTQIKPMRVTFPVETSAVVLDNGRQVELHIYTGDVLGAESSSVTHVSGTVVGGHGSVSSHTISTGQLWLRAENGAKKSFTIAGGLPFEPQVGHKVSVLSGHAMGRRDKETDLALHAHEYDATYWLQGEDAERTLVRTGIISAAWGLMAGVYLALLLSVAGIPLIFVIGIWQGARQRRMFKVLRAKALAKFDATMQLSATA